MPEELLPELLASAGLGLFVPKAEAEASGLPAYPWLEYFNKPLDVEEVRQLGKDYYSQGVGCAEGAFKALLDVLGEPFNQVPGELLYFGRGGGVGWATLCGAVNGAAAVVSLVYGRNPAGTAIINELFGWYSETALPLWDEAKSVAGNPLCHSSISNWVKASGKKSSERGPRCAQLTGDVAAQAALYMNQTLAGTFVPAYKMSAESESCLSCHKDDTIGKMECKPCHEDAHKR